MSNFYWDFTLQEYGAESELLKPFLHTWSLAVSAFARNMRADIPVNEKLVWIALTFVLSILSYFLDEKPFRNRQKILVKALSGILSLTSLVVVVFSGYAIYKDGVRLRFSELEILYGLNEFNNTVLGKKSWSILNGLASKNGYEESSPDQPSKFESETLWYSSGEKKRKILIIGNSVSKDMFNAFYQNAEKFQGYEFARFGTSPNLQEEQLSLLMKSPNFVHADTVIVRFKIGENSLEKFSVFIDRLKRSGKHVYLTSNFPFFWGNGATPLFDWYVQEYGNPDDQEGRLKALFFEKRVLNFGGDIDSKLRQLAQKLDIPFLNVWDLVCNFVEKTCDGVTPEGYKSYYDPIHWTLEGARHFGGRISELGWMEVQ